MFKKHLKKFHAYILFLFVIYLVRTQKTIIFYYMHTAYDLNNAKESYFGHRIKNHYNI